MLKWMPQVHAPIGLSLKGGDLPGMASSSLRRPECDPSRWQSQFWVKRFQKTSVLEEDQVDWIIDWESAGMGEEEF